MYEVSNLNPLNLATALIAQFEDLDRPQVDIPSFNWMKFCETAWLNQGRGAERLEFSRWMALCGAMDHDPVLLAAASFCERPDASAVAAAIESATWFVWPHSRAARAAALGAGDKETGGGLAQWTREASGANVLAWRLATVERYPTLDITKELAQRLHAAPASMLAWLFARDGFGADGESWLLAWSKQQGDLGFWSALALVLRRPIHHDKINAVLSRAESDPTRKRYAVALADAIQAGPHNLESAGLDVDALFEGSLEHRLTRAMRLAAFLPGQAPLVDPGMPTAWQERFAGRLRGELTKATTSGVSLAPAAYVKKEQQRQAQNDKLREERQKVRRRLAERLQARGWAEAIIAETLQSPVTYPVTGYAEGEALRYVHPRSGCSAVIDSATQEIVHVGRKDYRYKLPPGHDLTKLDNLPRTFKGDPDWSSFPRGEEQAIILVKLRDEMVDVWRPVRAIRMNKNIYGIVGQDIPRDEVWGFFINHFVACEMQDFTEGRSITAIQRVDQDNLYR